MFAKEQIIKAKIAEMTYSNTIKYSDVNQITGLLERFCTPTELKELTLLIVFDNGAGLWYYQNDVINFDYTSAIAGGEGEFSEEGAAQLVTTMVDYFEEKKIIMDSNTWFILMFNEEPVIADILESKDSELAFSTTRLDKDRIWRIKSMVK